MDPADITLSFVPSIRAGVATMGDGPDRIVLDEVHDRVSLLTPTAALVWSFIDATSSLEDFAVDLVDVLGVDPVQIRLELVDLAQDLGRRALLAGVDPDPTEAEGPAPAQRVANDRATRRLVAPASDRLDERFAGPNRRVITVRAPGLAFEVRTDDPELAEAVATALRSAGVDRDPPRPADPAGDPSDLPLYSLLAGRPTGPGTTLHFLYRSARPVRRSRHRDDLVRLAVADVQAVIARESADRPLLDAWGLVRDQRLVLVDPIFSSYLDDMERDLRRRGIERLDPSFVEVPPARSDRSVVGLVLPPLAQPEGHPPSPAELAIGAVDLARGVDRRIGAAPLGRLLDLVTSASIVRVPGRTGLRSAIDALLIS